MKDNFKY